MNQLYNVTTEGRKGKIKWFSFCNIYILLYTLYLYQGALLGTSGSMLILFILLFLIVVSLYHTVYVVTKYNIPMVMKLLTALVLMFSVYGLLLIISGKQLYFQDDGTPVRSYIYLKEIYVSLLPIYSFYYFTRKGQLDERIFPYLAVFILLVAIYAQIAFQNRMLAEAVALGSSREEFTNNMGYQYVALVPLITLLRKRPFLQYAVLVLSLLMIFTCMKRGAIIVGAVVIFYYLFTNLRGSSKRSKLWVFVGGVAVIAAGYFIMQYMMENSDYFNYRLQKTMEGDSSGRDSMYAYFINHFINQTNLLEFFFGGGANHTLEISTNYAHNDWLEIATDQGVLGLVIYVFFYVAFFRAWRRVRFSSPLLRTTFGCLFMIMFFKSLFSMSYGGVVYFEALAMGYCMAYLNPQKE